MKINAINAEKMPVRINPGTGKVSNDKDGINEPFILGSEPYSGNVNII